MSIKNLALFILIIFIIAASYILFDFMGLLSSVTIFLIVFVGTWVYRDAKERGLNPGLWTIIVLAIPNLVGLIIYFLVGRKGEVARCSNCKDLIPLSSNYCMNCGHEFKEKTEVSIERSASTTESIRIAFIRYCIVMLIVFGIFSYGVYKDEIFGGLGGISIGRMQNKTSSKWYIYYISSNENFFHSLKIENGKPKTMFIESNHKKGELTLHLVQDDMEKIIELPHEEKIYEIDLSVFKEGEVKVSLIGISAKRVKFKAHWE